MLVSQPFPENRSSRYSTYKTQVKRTAEKPQMRWESFGAGLDAVGVFPRWETAGQVASEWGGRGGSTWTLGAGKQETQAGPRPARRKMRQSLERAPASRSFSAAVPSPG